MAEAAGAGYLAMPLRKKLGVVAGQSTWRLAMPFGVAHEIDDDDPPALLEKPNAGLRSAHVFVTKDAV